jgi:hypothetical protein
MTISKHTPGPWYVSRYESNGDDLLSVDSEDRHITLHTYELPEDLANAHLIKAAPDMLDALKAIIGTTDKSGTGEMGLLRTIHDIYAIADAAIRNATL